MSTHSPQYIRDTTRAVWRPAGDQVVLLIVGDGTSVFKTLNETAALVWRHLDQPATCEDLAEAVSGEYECSREQVLPDVQSLLDDLCEQGLVKPLLS